jgi:hypothetical protein
MSDGQMTMAGWGKSCEGMGSIGVSAEKNFDTRFSRWNCMASSLSSSIVSELEVSRVVGGSTWLCR